MSPERKIEPVERVTLAFGEASQVLEKRLVGNASVKDAFQAVTIIRDARLEGVGDTLEDTLKQVGLDSDQKISLLHSYLRSVLSRNSSRGRRGREKEMELRQIGLLYEQLSSNFPDIAMSQAPEKGGRMGKLKSGRKWEDEGFTQED